MRKAVTMNHLVKLFVLAQALANAACELVEPEISIPVEVTQMIGTWDYAASFVAATTVVGASVTCLIAGVTITAGNPSKNSGSFGIYRFDAESSGGAVECTGDGTDDFVQELPAHVAVELQRSRCCWVNLNLTFPTPLGPMQVENHANVVSADDSITADYWNGRVVATVEPVMEFNPFNRRGRFIAVRR